MRILTAVLTMALLCVVGEGAAQAPAWPTKPLRLVLGYPAGGGADSVVRVFTAGMEKALGQPIVIDYRPGAGATLAAENAARSPADGYTIHYIDSAPLTITPHLRRLPYDPLTSFAAVSLVVKGGYVLVGHPSVGAESLRNLVELAKAKPGTISYGSAGIGGSGHLSGELMTAVTGARMVHVPYKGGAQAMADLIGGQVQLLFASAPTAVPQIQAGKIRAFAVTVPKRIAALPDVPTFAEQGYPDYEASVWFAMVMPIGTPPEIVARVREALVSAVGAPGVGEAIRKQGYEVETSTPDALNALIHAEHQKWGRVIREANIRQD